VNGEKRTLNDACLRGSTLRIAVIAPPWLAIPPAAYGGTESVLDALCQALVDAGHEVLLCASGDSTCPVPRVATVPKALGTEDMQSPAELRHVINAYQAVLAWGADLVHDHTIVGPFYAARHPQLSVITTNHGPFDGDLAPLYRDLAWRVPVIAISHHQASAADGIPLAGVIHHGVDPRRFPVGRGAGGYAAFLGRMNPAKGVDTAIRVARRAGMPLKIAAKMRERAEREYFQEEVEPLLGEGVDYVGEVGGDEKLALLADATCLLNPIVWPEPFGMVMIEALACGTPVVATPAGAAPEIVDDGVTGLLRRDEESLAKAVNEAPSLDRAACRGAVEARFSAQVMADRHIAVYQRLASRRSLGPVAAQASTSSKMLSGMSKLA
jgi:glycosyltransferase involved in cell wall biosynthesis